MRIVNKPIYQINTEGKIIKKFNNAKDAAYYTNGSESSVSKCLKGINASYKNTILIYEHQYTYELFEEKLERYYNLKNKSKSKCSKRIVAINKDTKEVTEYESIASASKSLFISASAIVQAAKGNVKPKHEYIFKYK